VFKLLLQVKYARFLLEKRDFHIRRINLLRKTSSNSYAARFKDEIEDLGA
jgi:hypothetical protein